MIIRYTTHLMTMLSERPSAVFPYGLMILRHRTMRYNERKRRTKRNPLSGIIYYDTVTLSVLIWKTSW